jgi:glycosyltransferase involved in cell wall biosynthesis
MPRPPAVSVIVCFLDEERFLDEALDSVFAQTFVDWELLLIDDGSSDGSSALARRRAAGYPDRVTYIEHEDHRNLGPAAARNAGLARARGRYIAFLDGDDAWYPRKLEEQIGLMERQPRAAMVVGASNYWRSWSGEPGSSDRIVPVGAPNDALIEPPELLTLVYPLGRGSPPLPSDLLMRREAVQAVGGFEASFRGPLVLYEDQAFLCKVYRRYPVYVASACWENYRLSAGSITASSRASGHYWTARLAFLRWLRNELARSGGTTAAVQAALDHALQEARSTVLRQRLANALRWAVPGPLRRWRRRRLDAR